MAFIQRTSASNDFYLLLVNVDVQDDDDLMGEGDLMLMLMFDLVLA